MGAFAPRDTMADWKDDDDLTSPTEGGGRPAIGVSHLGTDDSMTLRFADDGEKIDTKYGPAVAFDCELVRTDGRPRDDDGDEIPEGSDVRLITDSSRLLSWLKRFDLAGETFELIREGTGYDTAYTVVEADAGA